jgi:predicted nucleic acid-binding protein
VLAYLDSSVLLRKIFSEPNPLPELSKITYAVSSELLQVECLRTVDRYRVANGELENVFLQRLDLVYDAIERIEIIRITPEILTRAGHPFPSVLGTLDAIHLSTCLAYRDHMKNQKKEVVLCSHDEGLKRAAKALGIKTLG